MVLLISRRGAKNEEEGVTVLATEVVNNMIKLLWLAMHSPMVIVDKSISRKSIEDYNFSLANQAGIEWLVDCISV